MGRIRVLAIDDSVFVRKAIQRMFDSHPDIEVAGVAASGREGLAKAVALRPDVITLDVMMPEMDGIETLRQIMEKVPTPVLMLSQLTRDGADLTLKALELGAMDFVDKSSAGIMDFLGLAREITQKITSIAGARPISAPGSVDRLSGSAGKGLVDLLAIGASTGGPMALHMLLAKLPADIRFGVLVVQHMPRGFTAHLAQRLDDASAITVKEAEEGDDIVPGTALIAPAGLHMVVREGDGPGHRVQLQLEPEEELHRPSVSVLFASVGEHYGDRCVGVLLTGMGSDGVRGMRIIKERGGYTIAQDEATSVIYGMPRVAAEQGIVDRVLPLTAIAEEVLRLS